jgi:hypothetical protein
MQKEVKGQLAAQATAEAYHASARLPGQGNELRLMPYPVLLHAPTQSAIIKDSRAKYIRLPVFDATWARHVLSDVCPSCLFAAMGNAPTT